MNPTQQVVVAYAGRTLVRLARTSTGSPGFATPSIAYVIQRLVASETMTSAGIAGASYYVPHVRWTQYFSADVMALHENYWKAADQCGTRRAMGAPDWFRLTRNGCGTGATVGTPVIIHV